MILNAIKLSFAILVPRILLAPILAVLYVMAGILVGILLLILTMVSPVLALIVGVLITLALMSFPMVVCMRLGLGVHQIKITDSYGKLIFPAMIYGGVEALGFLICTVIGIAAFALLSTDMSFSDFGNLEAFANGTATETALATGDISALVIFLIGVLALSALRAALLVPLASAAAGRDANGQFHTPFVGFGSNLLPLTVLVILSYFALPLIAAAGVFVANLLGPTPAFSSIESLSWSGLGLQEYVVLISFWVGWIWVFCLQCAGGVLCYLKERDQLPMQETKSPEVFRMEPIDVRALRKSRA